MICTQILYECEQHHALPVLLQGKTPASIGFEKGWINETSLIHWQRISFGKYSVEMRCEAVHMEDRYRAVSVYTYRRFSVVEVGQCATGGKLTMENIKHAEGSGGVPND